MIPDGSGHYSDDDFSVAGTGAGVGLFCGMSDSPDTFNGSAASLGGTVGPVGYDQAVTKDGEGTGKQLSYGDGTAIIGELHAVNTNT
jgi:hypothetical protein